MLKIKNIENMVKLKDKDAIFSLSSVFTSYGSNCCFGDTLQLRILHFLPIVTSSHLNLIFRC